VSLIPKPRPRQRGRTAGTNCRPRPIHERFAQVAAERGDAPAVTAGADTLGYRELDERANQLAQHLRGLGVGTGRLVAVLCGRSTGMAVALLGTLKAGAAYLPLDPHDPPGRIERILGDAQPACVITDGETLPPGGVEVVNLESDGPSISRCPRTPPRVVMDVDDVAYVCFTSGSTGNPKGVRVPHRGVLRLAGMADYSAEDCFLQVAPLAFDASVFEIWCALLNGARLVLYPERRPTPDGLARLIRDERITVALLATGLFHRMVDGPIEALGGLRQLVFGGDVVSPSRARRARIALPHVRLTNGYGVAEATCLSACHDLTEAPPVDVPVPIGRPLPGTRLHVLDEAGRPCPVGRPGELHIAGEGLAAGYLGLPALTATRFVPEPDGSGLMYRTGDLASWRADGGLDFHGRMDTQVKIRGFRVEIGEVEAFLAAQPGVRQAVAVSRRRGQMAELQLVTYITTDSPAEEVVISRLRAAAHRELPHYLVPSTILALAEIPVTGNGKIDRDALPPPPERSPRQLAAPSVAPRTRLESLLVDLVADIVATTEVGVFDDFLALGGDSLAATDMAAEIRQTLEVEAPLDLIFGSWTVAQLAEALAPSVPERSLLMGAS
jgi:amino acid adenylation domain-containing protein